MKQRLHKQRQVGVTLLLLSTIAIGCAPNTTSGAWSAQTPTHVPPVLPYPGPQVTVTATFRPVPFDKGPLVTPDKNETLIVGEIARAAKSASLEFPYKYFQRLVATDAGNNIPQAVVAVGDTEIQLGRPLHASQVVATSPTWIVWMEEPTDESLSVTGPDDTSRLYAHELNTGKEILVYSGLLTLKAHTEGEWVVYAVDLNRLTSTDLPRDRPSEEYHYSLFAFNLVSLETIQVTDHLPIIWPEPASTLYAVAGGRVIWLDFDDSKAQYGFKAFDLSLGSTSSIDTKLDQPRRLSASVNYIVWQDTYWKGMDLKQHQVFTIPATPPGLEDKWWAVAHVTAVATGIEWTVHNEDGTSTFYQAAVSAKP